MGNKKKVASTYVKGKNYTLLSGMTISEELASPSATAYQLSDNVEEYGKLDPKSVYDKILSREFFIAHPEKTKTVRVSVSQC